MEILTLTDGGQTAESIASRVAEFFRPAAKTLEIALYDVRLPDPAGSIVADELRAAHERGVAVRLIYNEDRRRDDDARDAGGRPSPAMHPPPSTKPELLDELPIETRPVSGVPDLMHHKYAVRDGESVWTGSANWTTDSWSRQENVLAIVDSPALAQRYIANFTELWDKADVEHSGFVDPAAIDVDGVEVRAWFTPGHGDELSQRIATAIGSARERVRIASPVITSGPVLGTLAELADRRADIVAGVVDGPQVATVFGQWAANGHSAWKIPLLAKALDGLDFSAKPSTPWSPESKLHDFMHCKLTVADDTVFLGSFNLSRSGEQNAENMLEIHDPELAGRLAGFVDEIRARYPEAETPAQSRSSTSSGLEAASST
jgi:phosphatidylserine/phosphatidylglycerophosphate/cardiolipin synthase-like enzyme